jgi:hypothetical protein
MPARYVTGQDGVVLYSEVNPDYTHRPERRGFPLPVASSASFDWHPSSSSTKVKYTRFRIVQGLLTNWL